MNEIFCKSCVHKDLTKEDYPCGICYEINGAPSHFVDANNPSGSILPINFNVRDSEIFNRDLAEVGRFQDMVAKVNNRVCEIKDELIKEAITKEIGCGWSEDEVLKRMSCLHHVPTNTDQYTLDGKVIIAFAKDEIEQTATSIRPIVKYTFLQGDNDEKTTD